MATVQVRVGGLFIVSILHIFGESGLARIRLQSCYSLRLPERVSTNSCGALTMAAALSSSSGVSVWPDAETGFYFFNNCDKQTTHWLPYGHGRREAFCMLDAFGK